ncbi:hypothetical protein [Burkholderia gladioli]|uniref:hypothetical protein n=1 Tax=Burkholderia gladioli TaxID=28095 RepID=UPI00163F0E93|nr:hypothetical protein [Burkholderia gladioli]
MVGAISYRGSETWGGPPHCKIVAQKVAENAQLLADGHGPQGTVFVRGVSPGFERAMARLRNPRSPSSASAQLDP